MSLFYQSLTFQSNQTSKQKLGDIFTTFDVFSLDDSKNAHIHQKAKENDNSLLKENTDNRIQQRFIGGFIEI